MSSLPPVSSEERALVVSESLHTIRSRIEAAAPTSTTPSLVAVSKYQPPSDILACYNAGQRDFGENYVQELVEKASQLPLEIRWHFIGTLQSNKSKILASIPNIHTIQTVTSIKAANALDKAIPAERTTSLNILLQVNTSSEDAKSGLAPLVPGDVASASKSELTTLALHIVKMCPHLHLQGLMTIGSLTESLASKDSKETANPDFETLKQTRDALQEVLQAEGDAAGRWGEGGRLMLSMGMSSDFEAALRAGSDIVRVGTGIFGARHLKGEPTVSK